jgi:hypothetical protein
MGFAGAKIGQFHPLGAQLGGFRGNGHGRRNLNAADALGKDVGSDGCGHSYYLGRLLPIRGSFKMGTGLFADLLLQYPLSGQQVLFGVDPDGVEGSGHHVDANPLLKPA